MTMPATVPVTYNLDRDAHTAELLVCRYYEVSYRTAAGAETFLPNCFAIPRPDRVPIVVNHGTTPVARVRQFLFEPDELRARIAFYDSDPGWFDGWCRAEAGEFTGSSVSIRPIQETTVGRIRAHSVCELVHVSLTTDAMTPAYTAPGLVSLGRPVADLLARKWDPKLAERSPRYDTPGFTRLPRRLAPAPGASMTSRGVRPLVLGARCYSGGVLAPDGRR